MKWNLTLIGILVFWIVSPSFSTDASELLGSILGGQGPVGHGFYYGIDLNPQAEGASAPGIYENRGRAVGLLSKTDTDTWGVQGTFGNIHFGNPAVLADRIQTLSSDFWEFEVGLSYRHQYSDGREWSTNFSLGTASDIPFNSMNETAFQYTGTYRLPGSDDHSWFFLLNWSNNRPFLNYIPIPGLGYGYRSMDRRVAYLFGFPVNYFYIEFSKRFYVRGSFIGISQASFEWSQDVYFPLRSYIALDWGQKVWLPAGRTDLADRLFFNQFAVSIGLRSPLSQFLMLDLSLAYSFSRRLFLSKSYYSYRGDGQVAIDPGWIIHLGVSVRDLKQLMK